MKIGDILYIVMSQTPDLDGCYEPPKAFSTHEKAYNEMVRQYKMCSEDWDSEYEEDAIEESHITPYSINFTWSIVETTLK